MTRHAAPSRAPRLIACGAALGICLPPTWLAAQSLATVAPAASPSTLTPRTLPTPQTGAQGDVRTYAPIFPTAPADQPQPWSPSDGPVLDAANPDQAPDVADRTTPGAGRESRPTPDATPSGPTDSPSLEARDEALPAAAPTPTDVAPAGIVELVNRDRAAAGCPAVTADPTLTIRAQQWAEQQARDDVMRHSTAPDGVTMWGENVAVGYDTEADVHAAWIESTGHRANILNCEYRWIGIGHADGETGRYWTEQFAA